MGLSHLKCLWDSQCAVLEPFRKLDSSWWIPSKDRFMRIYWNRQKASLWQEAMGNTRTGMHAHGNRGSHPGSPVGICLCLLFAFVPGFHFSWFYHARDVFSGSGRLHKEKAPLSWSYNQLQLLEKLGGGERGTGQERNVSVILCPGRFSLSLATIFFVF